MDLHRHPFDEGTITKLEIFEVYTKEWLPVFVMSPYKHICIFDLFAGTGRDQKGVAGSPIRILQQINGMLSDIVSRGKHVYLWLNEYDHAKYELRCFSESTNNPAFFKILPVLLIIHGRPPLLIVKMMGKVQISFAITLKSEINIVYLQRISGYVLTLQNFDRLIKEGVKDGTIIVSENKIETDKKFDL